MSLKIVQHATCTFCGCVCDDIELHAEGDRIVKTKGACSLGESWFKNHTAERLYPDALINGQPACAYNPVFLNLYVRHLDALRFSLPNLGRDGVFHRHIGDASVPGKGELLVWRADGGS
jgi:hypothetical protein